MISLLFALVGCPAPATPIEPAEPGCALCSPETFCVLHTTDDGAIVDTTCAPFPVDCGDPIDCDDNTCREAVHAHCDPGFDPSACRDDEIICIEEDGT